MLTIGIKTEHARQSMAANPGTAYPLSPAAADNHRPIVQQGSLLLP
jgi:hypothetical protein